VRRGERTLNDLVNTMIASIFFRNEGEIDDFHEGFLEGFGAGGEATHREAWSTVLSEFGRYYGREFRRQTIGLDEVAGFLSQHVIPRTETDLNSFARGFDAGHGLPRAGGDLERILNHARR
jgi:hypothetical protein